MACLAQTGCNKGSKLVDPRFFEISGRMGKTLATSSDVTHPISQRRLENPGGFKSLREWFSSSLCRKGIKYSFFTRSFSGVTDRPPYEHLRKACKYLLVMLIMFISLEEKRLLQVLFIVVWEVRSTSSEFCSGTPTTTLLPYGSSISTNCLNLYRRMSSITYVIISLCEPGTHSNAEDGLTH